MEDDLIDDSGFELGMPTPVEMLKHQCTLLCGQLETTRLDLRNAHRDIAKLIVIHRDCSTETELAALIRTLSAMNGSERTETDLRQTECRHSD